MMEEPKLSNTKIEEPIMQNGENKGNKAQLSLFFFTITFFC